MYRRAGGRPAAPQAGGAPGNSSSSPARRIQITNDRHGSSPGRRRHPSPSDPSYPSPSYGIDGGGGGGGVWRNGGDGGGGGGGAPGGPRRRVEGGGWVAGGGGGDDGRTGGFHESSGARGPGQASAAAGKVESSPPHQRGWNHARRGGRGGNGGGDADAQEHTSQPVVIEPSSAAIGGRGWDRSPGRSGHRGGVGGYRGNHDREQRYSGGPGFGGPGGLDGLDRGGSRFGNGGAGGAGGFRDSRPRGATSHRYARDTIPQQHPRGGAGEGRPPTTHIVGRESWEQLRAGGGGSRGAWNGNNSGQYPHGTAPPREWGSSNPGGGMLAHRVSHREDSRTAPPRYGDHGVGNVPPANLARHHYPVNGGGGSSRELSRRWDRSRSRSKERTYNNGLGSRDVTPPGRERFGGGLRGGFAGREGGGGGGGLPPSSYRRFSPGPPASGFERRGGLRSDRGSPGRDVPRRGGGGYGRYPGFGGGGGGGVSPRPENLQGPLPVRYAGEYRNGGGGEPSGGRDMRFLGGGGGGSGRGYAYYAMVNRRDYNHHPQQHQQDYRRDESGRRGGRGGGAWGGGGGGRQNDRSSSRRGGARGGGDSGGGDHSGGNDDEGHYKGKKGDLIGGRYEILGDVGLGTFGRVVECWDIKRRRRVAVKVVRKVAKYHDSALIEADILRDVNSQEASIRRSDSSLCVEMFAQLEHQGHCCLVFECLGRSLYDYLKKNDYRGFPMNILRAIARELLQAIEFLHSMKLIHTDLKPENILLKSWEDRDVTLESGEVIRVPMNAHIKVIDFGGATYERDSHASVVNTRQYRAPEVILGLRWLYPSDLWSVGCIIAELFLGDLLFATHNNLEHLALMEKCVGMFPQNMLLKAPRTRDFFDEATGVCKGATECDAENRRHIRRMKRLEDITAPVESTGLGDLLQKLLTLDPKRRSTATEALCHRFFTEGL